MDSSLNKWRQVVKGAVVASQIGRCRSKDSFKKQQNLQKAIQEAKRMAAKSPEIFSRSITPIELPDISGSDLVSLIRDEKDIGDVKKRLTLSPNVIIQAVHSPSISIIPPQQSPKMEEQEHDLINLESAKNSPESLRKTVEVPSEETSSEKEEKSKLEKSPTPPASQADSLDSNKSSEKALADEIEQALEGIADSSHGNDFRSQDDKLDDIRSLEGSQEDIDKLEDLDSKGEGLENRDIDEQAPKIDKPVVIIVEPNEPIPTTSIEMTKETGQKPEDKPTSLSVKPESPRSRPRTPMGQRNIQKIGDSSSQPKYGWL